MIRTLKVLLAAAMALAAFGVMSASGAQAAEFHCSAEPCTYTARADGTGKTGHQVFIVENEAKTESVSFTCETITGKGTSPKTAATTTLKEVKYGTCTVNGSPGVEVRMNKCNYEFSAAGTVTVLNCEVGKPIEVEITSTGCIFTIGNQGPLSKVSYHTIGTTPNREVTVETNVTGIVVTADNTGCSINTGQKLIGTYTTGNAIVRGATSVGVMADAWFE